MLILHLLFFATIALVVVYSIFGTLDKSKGDAVVTTLSWALAVHASLFVVVLMTSCKTDTGAVRATYALGALLLVANAVMDSVGSHDRGVAQVLGVAAVVTGLLILGLVRTEMFKQCIRYKGLIRASYAAQRDPNAPREQKVDIAERVIKDLRLAPNKIRRMLRL